MRIWKGKFLKELRRGGSITAAAKVAGIGRELVYKMMWKYPKFKEKVEAAKDRSIDGVEDTAIIHAIKGWKEPVYQGGALIGYVRKYDHRLMAMILERRRSEKYAPKTDKPVENKEPVTEVNISIKGAEPADKNNGQETRPSS